MLDRINSGITTKAPASGEKRITVEVADDLATIKFATFAEGLGWCVQKTIKVDADMLDLLVGSLSEAQGKIIRCDDAILSAETLEF